MTEFKEGQHVRIDTPGDGREATFIRVADPDEAIEVPHERGTRKADAALVQFEDGDMERVPYYQLRAVE